MQVYVANNFSLDGCHNDKSRDSIKKKVGQYLDRAEKIKNYLESTNNKEEVSFKLSYFLHCCCHILKRIFLP